MQKVAIYGECPQCGDYAKTECWAEEDFICRTCRIIWTQVERHEDYSPGVYAYEPNFYYVYDVWTWEDAFGPSEEPV
jgi:hypothetical protein